ncbi:MAG: A/G-specific adenine glycosylase [Kordiimonas sp.]|nr:A/G-specific adenine glycosylase [Kordiimonas sp.]|tara:strand:- start:2550 stop:3659 length:1110 start_codon:yes stop_codon:yes gene_type:complete
MIGVKTFDNADARSNREAAEKLLAWYDVHARDLPWRVGPWDRRAGEAQDPYRVWLSEIMLQQTTVATVKSYYEKFVRLWPTVQDLAAAPLDDVLTAWAGLGYYARARNLHKCAVIVANERQGIFPDSEEGLLKLPGIGPYTAAAIAAIAYDVPSTVVDGNVERVISRLYNIHEKIPDSRPILREKAESLTPRERSGDYAQAIMDLGATICTPRKLHCGDCPWQQFCQGRAAGTALELPKKKSKADLATRRGFVFWVEVDGRLWLRKRPEQGLLGGMMEIPSSNWVECAHWQERGEPRVPIIANWTVLPGIVRHTFTHFHLELKVMRGALEEIINLQEGEWVPLTELQNYPLPTVMKKVIDMVRAPMLDL